MNAISKIDIQSAQSVNYKVPIFGCALCVFVLTAASADPIDNGNVIAVVAESIVIEGQPTYPGHLPGYSVVGPDGKSYGKFGLGMSLVLIPAVFITRVLSLGESDADTAHALSVFIWHFFPSLIGAFSFVLLVRLGMLFGMRLKSAILGAFIAVFTTPVWIYFRVFYSEGLLALCIIGMCVYALKWKRNNHSVDGMYAWFFAGSAVLTKPTGFATLGVFAIYSLVLIYKSRKWRHIIFCFLVFCRP